MRIAVMQPYLFPYIGYFQLIESVDKFVVYDDVTFIKQGWINRNNILLNGKAFLFTVPILNVSSFTLIKDTLISRKQPWAEKLLKTLEQAYKKGPFYSTVAALVERGIKSDCETIGAMATESIRAVCQYLGIATEIITGSAHYANQHLSAQDRIIDICKQEKASQYHNPIGGQELYSKEDFAAEDIKLHFIKTPLMPYPQFKDPFVPWLSIIDVLMFNEPVAALQQIRNYELT